VNIITEMKENTLGNSQIESFWGECLLDSSAPFFEEKPAQRN